jgi:hypothetical protein
MIQQNSAAVEEEGEGELKGHHRKQKIRRRGRRTAE